MKVIHILPKGSPIWKEGDIMSPTDQTIQELRDELLSKFEEVFDKCEEPEPEPKAGFTLEQINALAEFFRHWELKSAEAAFGKETPLLFVYFKPRPEPRKVILTDDPQEPIHDEDLRFFADEFEFIKSGKDVFGLDCSGSSAAISVQGMCFDM